MKKNTSSILHVMKTKLYCQRLTLANRICSHQILQFLYDCSRRLMSSHRSTNKNHHSSSQVISLIILCNMSKIPSSYRSKSCRRPFFLGKLTVWRLMVCDKNLWEGFTLIERRGQGLVLPEVEGYESDAEDNLSEVSKRPWDTGVFTFRLIDVDTVMA